MNVTYTSPHYSRNEVKARYVRFDGKQFRFCEVGTDRQWDLRQGTVDEVELPPDVATQARERYGSFPPYVAWPL